MFFTISRWSHVRINAYTFFFFFFFHLNDDCFCLICDRVFENFHCFLCMVIVCKYAFAVEESCIVGTEWK